MKKKIKQFFFIVISFFVSIFVLMRPLLNLISIIRMFIYSEFKRRDFLKCNNTVTIHPQIKVIGGKNISIGNNVNIGKGSSIGAWNNYKGQKYNPSILIGDDCKIGEMAHITAINRIILGTGVLLGKYVLISDNSHGRNTLDELNIQPNNRTLYSKGEVIIGNNVWIGDKASILSGVHIGNYSIIAANSVVTKDIPENCVAGGCPAKVIRRI